MIGRLGTDLIRSLLRLAQLVCVVLANLPRRTPRRWRRHPSWDLLKAHRIAARVEDGDSVLDVGCGSGHTLAELAFFRRIDALGVDVSLARSRFAEVSVRTYDGRTLPFPDGRFDVTLVCYVLHHLSPDHAARLFAEIMRVTRRRIVLIEDSLPRFGRLYRLRNRIHRIEAGLEYRSECRHYRPPRDEAMFLTYEGWRSWLRALPGVESVEVESLATVSRYDHHALIDVKLAART